MVILKTTIEGCEIIDILTITNAYIRYTNNVFFENCHNHCKTQKLIRTPRLS